MTVAEPGRPDPHVRASDAERDAVAEVLREAHAEGRLSVTEFADRLDAVYAARTLGELEPLTADLPTSPPTRPRTGDEASPARRDTAAAGLRAAWGVWTVAVLVNLVVWAGVSLSAGHAVYFWPGWVAGPWGAVLLARTLAARRGGNSR